MIPAPTPPTQMAYGCWPVAYYSAFDYPIVTGQDVAMTASPCVDPVSLDPAGLRGGDSTTLYWWGGWKVSS